MRARPTCSCAAARPGASSRSSQRPSRQPATASASPSPSRATPPSSGPPPTTSQPRRGLGLRVRAQRLGLEPAAEAHRRGRLCRRPVRLLRRRFGRHSCSRGQLDIRWLRRPARPTCSCATATTWTRAAEAHGQRRGGRRLLRRLGRLAGDTARDRGRLDDHAGSADAGSAYVFVRNGTTWTEQRKLTASDAAPDDYFGMSVSLAGDTAVVGLPAYSRERGGLRVRAQREDLERATEAHGQRPGHQATTSAPRSASRATRRSSASPGTTWGDP